MDPYPDALGTGQGQTVPDISLVLEEARELGR